MPRPEAWQCAKFNGSVCLWCAKLPGTRRDSPALPGAINLAESMDRCDLAGLFGTWRETTFLQSIYNRLTTGRPQSGIITMLGMDALQIILK